MKKKTLGIIIASTCVFVGIAAGAFFFFTKMQKPLQGSTIESVLPQGAFAYIHINDVKKNMDFIGESELGKTLYDLNYEQLYNDKVISKVQFELISYLKKKIPSFVDSLVFEKFFSQEIALAIYKTNIGFDSAANMGANKVAQLSDFLSTGALLVTKIPLDAQIAENFLDLFSEQFKDVVIKGEEYRGYTVRTVKFKNFGIKLSVITLKNYLVIGLGDQAVKLSIDTFGGLQSSLAQDSAFQNIKGEAGSAHSFLFNVDLDFVFSMLKNEIISKLDVFNLTEDQQREALDKIKKSFVNVASFHHLNIFLDSQPTDISKAFIQFFYDQDRMSVDLAGFYECPATVNQTTRFIPSRAIAYQWNNCIRFDSIWKELKEEHLSRDEKLSQDPKNQLLIDFIEKGILSALKDEVGGYLVGVRKGNMFPIPEMAVFIKIANEELVSSFLEKLKDAPFFFVRPEAYQGVNYNYITFPMKVLAEPSYCFLDDYLVVAMDQKVLKLSIDAYKDPSQAISASSDFMQKGLGLDKRIRGVQFFKVNELAGVIDRTIEMQAETTEKRALRQQAMIQRREQRIEELKVRLEKDAAALDTARKKKQSMDAQAQALPEGQKLDPSTEAEFHEAEETIKHYEALILEEEGLIEKEAAFIRQFGSEVKVQGKETFLKEFVRPVLRAVETWKTLTTKSNIGNGLFELQFYWK